MAARSIRGPYGPFANPATHRALYAPAINPRRPSTRTTDPTEPPTARRAALDALARQAKRYPDLAADAPTTTGLSTTDAALAHAIYDAAVARWITIEHLLDLFLRTPARTLPPHPRAILISGAAQAIFLDRVPAYAVVNESVELARQSLGTGHAGMVNAVLRKVAALRAEVRERWTDRNDEVPLSDGRALGLTRGVMPQTPGSRLSIATSHPDVLLQRWVARWGWDTTRDLALHSLADPPTLLNIAHAARPLSEDDNLSPGPRGHLIFRGPRARLSAILEERPDIWAQDPASAAALDPARELRPSLIVDLCAGQGTKTRQLAAMFPSAAIIASDADDDRMAVLRRSVTHLPNVAVTPFAEVEGEVRSRADLVLTDVPCSNSGVLPRRVEARYRFTEDQLARLARIQGGILARARGLLGPGGRILYTTCSLEDEENERHFSDTPVASMQLTMPSGQPGGDPVLWSDGSFSCVTLPRP